ncbi:hypothetical protein GGE26_003784 [Agrobacterium tumefaciens]|jgi:hypothetical protein|nr:hypothetical protein [Agrobacterium radiobacter]
MDRHLADIEGRVRLAEGQGDRAHLHSGVGELS